MNALYQALEQDMYYRILELDEQPYRFLLKAMREDDKYTLDDIATLIEQRKKVVAAMRKYEQEVYGKIITELEI